MRKIKVRPYSGTKSNEITDRERKGMAVARKAAADGIVLLENKENVLPISKGSRVALYGSGVSNTIKGGTGSGDVNERHSVTIAEGFRDAGYVITTEEWIEDYSRRFTEARNNWRDEINKNAEGKDFFTVYTTTPFVRPVGMEITKTDADTAFYVISRVAGEGADRFDKEGDYLLTKDEEKELNTICELYEKVVVVLNVGGVIDLSFMDEHENILGLILYSQAGMEGGHALTDVVSGDVTPSGKLTATWAYKYSDYPNAAEFSHNNGNTEEEFYNEGIYVGYRYFDSYDIPARYCFGYGLSYTDFEIETEDIAEVKGEGFDVTVSVRNTGEVSGKEVVQVYFSCPDGKIEKEDRRLAAFAKTKLLNPGEVQKIVLHVPFKALTSYSEEIPGWVLEKGIYGVFVGNSLDDSALDAAIELTEDVVTIRTEHICTPKKEVKEYHRELDQRIELSEVIGEAAKIDGFQIITVSAADIPVKTIEYKTNAELADAEGMKIVDTLSEDQIKQLATGDPGKGQDAALGAAGNSVPGSAAQTSRCAEDQGIASIVLADGPAGLRLMKYYFVKDGSIVNMPFQFSLEGGIFCKDADKTEGERYYQYCTAVPVGTMLAQTWDTELVSEIGTMVAGEMQEFGVTLWLAPGMNIQRNPLCGRNFEYYSEDPLVSGKIAAAMTNGVQKIKGCGTTIKHFACNNNEDNRMNCDSIMTERTMREIYLKGFEIAIEESQPMSMMTSYPVVNGIHAANNYDLCTKAARNEFGFKGLIMTDWTTTHYGPSCTAAGCMRAGNDIVMPGCANDQKNLTEELASGALKMEDLKACVSRFIRTVLQSDCYED